MNVLRQSQLKARPPARSQLGFQKISPHVVYVGARASVHLSGLVGDPIRGLPRVSQTVEGSGPVVILGAGA